MILIEDRLSEIFGHLPEINGNAPIFRYGDDKELNVFLNSTKRNIRTPYPLIWLVYPYKEEHHRASVKAKLELVLAVKTNTVMLNDERLIKTYKGLLIPLWDNIKEGFKKANIINTDDNFEVIKFPNYGESDKSKSVDIWDALKITFDARFNDNPLLTIKY